MAGPGERGDPVALADAQVGQGDGQTLDPIDNLGVRVVHDASVGQSGGHLFVGKKRLSPPQNGRDRQRIVHHQAAHRAGRYHGGQC